MAFDIDAARKAGKTDDQIANYLGEKLGFDVDAARKSGKTSTQIAEYLSTHEKPKTIVPPTETPEQSRNIMANIQPLTPEQELGVPVQTPEEQEQARKEALHFVWPGVQEAKKQFIKGTTPALQIAGATVGSLYGPWGTGLGWGAGGRLGKTIEVATGVSKPETLPEAAVETVKDVAIGMLPYGVEKAAKIPGAIKAITKAGKVKAPLEKMGGEMKPSIAGETVTKGAREAYTSVTKQGNKLYEVAKNATPKGSNVNLDNTYNVVDAIVKNETLAPAEKKIAQDVLSRISPEVRTGGISKLAPELQEQIKGELGIITRPTTFEEAYSIRSELSKLVAKGGRVGHQAGEILDALNQDLVNGANKLGLPQVTKAYQKAIDFWRDEVIPQRQVVKLIESKSVEKVPIEVLRDLKTVEKLKKGLPEDNFQNLKQGLLTDIYTKAENNPIKIAAKIRELLASKQEVMQSVFTKEELGALQRIGDIRTLEQWFKEHPKTRWIAKGIGVAAGTGVGIKILKSIGIL